MIAASRAPYARVTSVFCFARGRATGSLRPRSPGLNIRSYVYKGLGFFDADEIKDVLALVSYLADPVSDLCAAALMRSRFFGVSDEALRRLAPNLSETLTANTPPLVLSALDSDDRDALAEARQATGRWRSLVDRLPAAELVDPDPQRVGLRIRTPGPQIRPGTRESQEDPVTDAAHAEPRFRDGLRQHGGAPESSCRRPTKPMRPSMRSMRYIS